MFGLISLLVASLAVAAPLSPKEIRERLELRTDIYELDAAGDAVIGGPIRTGYSRMNAETGELKGDWSSRLEGNTVFVGIRYDFKVGDKGQITARIEQYSGRGVEDVDPKLKDLVKRDEISVRNLQPIVLKIESVKAKNFVARFVLSLREISRPISVDNLPIAGVGITVSDSKGYLWAQGAEFSGKFSGLVTHRGAIAFSYLPFAGATEMGMAEGNTITLSPEKGYTITLKAEQAFLPSGVAAKVYAMYRPNRKTSGFNSLHTFDTQTEKRISEVMSAK